MSPRSGRDERRPRFWSWRPKWLDRTPVIIVVLVALIAWSMYLVIEPSPTRRYSAAAMRVWGVVGVVAFSGALVLITVREWPRRRR